MTARDDAIERARRLRVLIEACEEIAADDTDPRQQAAFDWLTRILGNDLLSGYPSVSASVIPHGDRAHSSGAGHAMHDDIVLEGWKDARP